MSGIAYLQRVLALFIVCLCFPASVLAAPVPVAGDAPVAVDHLRLGNPAVLPMTGTWRFKLDHGVSPAVKGELPADAAVPAFVAPEANDMDWKNILVPANWEVEGFSIPTYQERTRDQSTDIGLYRRLVDVPASFAGHRVLWHFDGAYDGAEVFVNGQRCGYHESGFTAFDIDVTKTLKPGQRNLMAVRLYKNTSSASLDHGDFWCLGGIYRETYLVALPQLHVDDVTVVTDLDAQYKDATLKSTVRVAGPAGAHFVLTGELRTLDGAKVAIPAMSQAGDIGADGFATVVLTAPVTAPKLWSAEKPNLYYVFYRLSDGNQTVVERVQDRIGFRKVELKNGVVQVNGVPIKFTGVCRHEEFASVGHASNEECWKTDINLMKAANVMAIRTAHYNHAERFLELCDEAGFYVLDEIPSCWVASEIKDATRTWAYVFRSKETLARDKNRACVVVWSCGNESSYGVNNQAEFDYMKANDPTRLALISQVSLGQNPKTDFADYHYPPIPQMKSMLTSPDRVKVPAIYTEIGGIEDPWGQILFDNWTPIWSSDGITGAFIWEWQEQNLLDKFPERWNTPSPGARGIDLTTGLRLSGGGGAVTADRQIKPNRYWNLKMVYSPVTTAAREVDPVAGQCVVAIQNRYSFTDLSELTCRWQALAGEKELAKGESHIAAKPRSTVDATFPATAGMDTLRLEFIHPDGRSVYAARLRTKGYQGPAAPAALAAAGPIRLSDTDQSVTVQAAGTQLVLDKRTGLITSWRAGDRDIVLGGPILNLGESIPGGGGRGVGPGGRGRGAAPVNSSQAPQYRNPVVTAKMDGANAKLAVTTDVYLAGSDELKGQLTYTLDIGPDAQADLAWNLVWKAADATAREAGLKFLLPATTDRMSWLSDSLFTEYPADHIGSPQGSVTSKDTLFSSSKRDIRWTSLSGAGSYSLVALSTGKPLHTHGLADNSGVTLFLSSGIASTGRDVTGDDIRLTQATPLSGGFRLRVANATVAGASQSLSYLDPGRPIEARVEDLLGRMTLEEKAAMCYGNSTFTAAGVARLGVPDIWMDDGPMGVREEVGESFRNMNRNDDFATAMPAALGLAATFNPDLATAYGTVIGQEAKQRGKNIMLGPSLNIQRTPLCGRNFEYMGEDPFLTSRIAVQYIKGEQAQGVSSCAKHYAANNQELQRGSINVEMDERTLREIYLPAFRAAVQEAGTLSVMGAYNLFRGQHCCENDYLLNKVLKDEWGFKGVVVSDWSGVHSTDLAALNGMDIEMGSRTSPPYDTARLGRAFLDGLKSGKFPMSVLDDKVRRHLYVMFKLNLIHDPNAAPPEAKPAGPLSTPAHQAIARQVAEESMVLLKNEGLLPLNPSAIKSIAVIGINAETKFAHGGGAANIKAPYEITALEGIQKRVGDGVKVTYAAGYALPRGGGRGGRRGAAATPPAPVAADPNLLAEAVTVAKAADVVIYVGGLSHAGGYDNEGSDRQDLKLPGAQDDVLAKIVEANPKTVVVFMGGGAVEMGSWLSKTPALLYAWYPGLEGGNALARVLFGDVSPSGKLPCTFPKQLADSPAHALNAYPGTNGTVTYTEGLLVGYRWFDTKQIEPLFPFGHGLSYTTFEYSGLKLVDGKDAKGLLVTVEFDLANTGKREGAEVVQVYVQDVQSSQPRPVKELKGIAKVSLKPGQKQRVSVPLDRSAFAYYDQDKKGWVAEAGDFKILVASSSRNIRLQDTFKLASTTVEK